MSSSMFTMNDKLYHTTKWTVQIVLPALATLYATLGDLWGWPHLVEIPATFTAIAMFLGIVLGISTYGYNNSEDRFDGTMRVNKSNEGQIYDLELNGDPLNLATKKEINFKVDRST